MFAKQYHQTAGAAGGKNRHFFKISVPESVKMTTRFLLHGFRLYIKRNEQGEQR